MQAMSGRWPTNSRSPLGGRSVLRRPLVVPMEMLASCDERRSGPIRPVDGADQEEGDTAASPVSAHRPVFSSPVPPVPPLPATTAADPSLLQRALHEAARTANPRLLRFAINMLELRGDRNHVVASDAWQAPWQAGFELPWQGDLLVLATAVFGTANWPDQPLSIGQAAGCGRIGAGNWIFWSVRTALRKASLVPFAECDMRFGEWRFANADRFLGVQC